MRSFSVSPRETQRMTAAGGRDQAVRPGLLEQTDDARSDGEAHAFAGRVRLMRAPPLDPTMSDGDAPIKAATTGQAQTSCQILRDESKTNVQEDVRISRQRGIKP